MSGVEAGEVGEKELVGGSSGSLIGGGGGAVEKTATANDDSSSQGEAMLQMSNLLKELSGRFSRIEQELVEVKTNAKRMDNGFKEMLAIKVQEEDSRGGLVIQNSSSSSSSSSTSGNLGQGEETATTSGSSSSPSSGSGVQGGGGEKLVTTAESSPKAARALVSTRSGEAIVNWTAADRAKMSSDSDRTVYFMNPEGDLSLNTKNSEANSLETLRGRRAGDKKIVLRNCRANNLYDFMAAMRMYEANMLEALKSESSRVRGGVVSSVSMEFLVRVAAKSTTDEYGVFGESWMWWMKGERPASKSGTESLLLLECTGRVVLLSSLSCSSLIEVLEEAQDVIIVLMGASVSKEERKLFDTIIVKLRAMGLWSSLDAEFILRELDRTLENALMALGRPMYESKILEDGECEDTLISFNSTNGPYRFLRNTFEKFAFDVHREQNARLKKSFSGQNTVTQTQAGMLVGGGAASPNRDKRQFSDVLGAGEIRPPILPSNRVPGLCLLEVGKSLGIAGMGCVLGRNCKFNHDINTSDAEQQKRCVYAATRVTHGLAKEYKEVLLAKMKEVGWT